MIRAALAALGMLAAACDRAPTITTCSDDLGGAWRDEATGHRWMILDTGAELEVYPLFPDVPPTPSLEVAPRVLDLARTGDQVTGDVKRRFMRGAEACIARAAVRVTTCSPDALELVLGEPSPPLAFAPCQAARPTGSHRERWRRP